MIQRKGKERAVNQLTMEGLFIKEFRKMEDAATETKTSCGSISDCCRGNIKSANGFRWEYCNKYLKLLKAKEALADDLIVELHELFIENEDEDEFFEICTNRNNEVYN